MESKKRNIIILIILGIVIVGGIVGGIVISRKGNEDLTVSTSSEDSRGSRSIASQGTDSSSTSLITSDQSTGTEPTLTSASAESTSIASSSHASSTSSLTPSSTTSSESSSVPSAHPSSTCQNPRVRKEWRDLSSQEQAEYIDAVNQLMKKPSQNGHETRYMDFVRLHIDVKSTAHHSNVFLLWHRQYIFEFEKELRLINSNINLPYWDWAMDSQNVVNSPIFANNAFGGDGDPHTNCIVDGGFANISTEFSVIDHSVTSDKHCVRRKFKNNQISSPSVLSGLVLANPNYTDFTLKFEQLPHSQAHNAIGGDMVQYQSPSDPIFFLIHSNADRFLQKWQIEHPDSKYPDSMDQNIPAYDVKISKLFQSPDQTSDFCYTYDKKTVASIQKRNVNPRKSVRRKILQASPVNPAFTKMMGGDPQKVKKWESDIEKYVDCLNDLDYQSPAVSYAIDRNWQNHKIKTSSWRFPKDSKERAYIDKCLKFLRDS